jgi:spermidine/putrescine transport system ATP-binding protein
VPKSRIHSQSDSVLLGVRPEKLRIYASGTSQTGNQIDGGVITDVSYIGVSTQYQVELPWKQEIMVFEQNDDGTPPLDKGDRVIVSWEPNFTFGLDGDSDVSASSKVENND